MPDTPTVMLARIRELLGTGKYEWARETLTGIYANIESTNRVSLRQQEAVEHIIVGRLRHDVRE
jgi:hypothetical protein